MIIACPQCDTRFVVPSTIFARGGRKVRCASCKHEWFQEDALEANEGEDAPGDFAAAMRNTAAQDSYDDDGDNGFLEKVKQDFKAGTKIILAAFATVLFIYFAYQLFKPTLIKGEGLAFNDIQIEQSDNGLVMTGEIVNTVNERRAVPSLKVISILANDVQGDAVLMAPDKDILESGEVLEFTYVLDNVAPEAEAVNITFAVPDADSDSY